EALGELVAQLDQKRGPKSDEPPVNPADIKKFLERFKGKSIGLDLARTVMKYAAKERCSPERLRFLDTLLRDPQIPPAARQRDPLYVETLLLRRLVELAAEYEAAKDRGAIWPVEAVPLALRAAWDGELAAACIGPSTGQWEPRALPWIRKALND